MAQGPHMITKTIHYYFPTGYYGLVEMISANGYSFFRGVMKDGRLAEGQYFSSKEQAEFALANCPDTFELTPEEHIRTTWRNNT